MATAPPPFAIRGGGPLANSATFQKAQAVANVIAGHNNLQDLQALKTALPKLNWEGKLGPTGVAYVSHALDNKISQLQGGGAMAMPSPSPVHPFEQIMNTLEKPEQGIMAGLDQFAKMPFQQKVNYLMHPSVEQQQNVGTAFDQGVSGQRTTRGGQVAKDLGVQNPVAQAVLGFGMETAYDPLSYVPLDEIVKPLSIVAKPIADAVKEQGIVNMDKLAEQLGTRDAKAAARVQGVKQGTPEYQALTDQAIANRRAALDVSVGKAHEAANSVKTAFNRFAGFPAKVKQAWQTRDAMTRFRISQLHDAVKGAMADYYKATGKPASEEVMQAVTHHVENKYYRPWLEKQGIHVPQGTQIAEGTPEHALAERLHEIAQEVTKGEVDLGLREAEIPGYVRHMNLDYRKPSMYGEFGGEAQGQLHAQTFNRERTVLDTIENLNKKAAASRLDKTAPWEANWLRSMGPRLEASIRSQETERLIQKILTDARRVEPKELAKLDYGELRRAGLGVYRPNSLQFFRTYMIADPTRIAPQADTIMQEILPHMAPNDEVAAEHWLLAHDRQTLQEHVNQLRELRDPKLADQVAKEMAAQDRLTAKEGPTIVQFMRRHGIKIRVPKNTDIREELRDAFPPDLRVTPKSKGYMRAIGADELVTRLQDEGVPVKDFADMMENLRAMKDKNGRVQAWRNYLPKAQAEIERMIQEAESGNWDALEKSIAERQATLPPLPMQTTINDAVRLRDILRSVHEGVAVRRAPGYILPRSVADALRTSGRRAVRTNGLLKAVDSLSNAWKWGMTRMPFFHLHNVLYNAFLGDGGMLLRKRFYQAIDDVKSHSDMFVRAQKAGAISEWSSPLVNQSLERDKQMLEAIQRYGGRPETKAQRFMAVMEGALWKTDQVMRISLFRKALDKGMNDQAAANFVNHFMVDYNDLTPFEQNVMRTLFPFYAWQRHNLPLQFEAWLHQTGKQLMAPKAVANLNWALNQHNVLAQQGKPGYPYDVLMPTSNPYANLALDVNVPAKDAQEFIDESPQGYAFGRLNPLLGIPAALMSGHPNPFDATGSYGQTNIYNPLLPGWVQDVPAFGNTGPMIDPRLAAALNVLPAGSEVAPLLSQVLGAPERRTAAAVPPVEQTVLSGLGFYPSGYNAAQAAQTQEIMRYIQMLDMRSKMRSYMRNYVLPNGMPLPVGPYGG